MHGRQLPIGSGPVSSSAAYHFIDADSHDDSSVVGVLGKLDRVYSSSEFISQSSCLEQLRLAIETDVPRLNLGIEAHDRDLGVASQVGEMATTRVLQIRQVDGVSDKQASFWTISGLPSSALVATKAGRWWPRAPLTAAAYGVRSIVSLSVRMLMLLAGSK